MAAKAFDIQEAVDQARFGTSHPELFGQMHGYDIDPQLLDALLAPGSFRSPVGVGRDFDPMQALLGNQNASGVFGLTPWDQLFGTGGGVLDPQALMRSLNLGSVASTGVPGWVLGEKNPSGRSALPAGLGLSGIAYGVATDWGSSGGQGYTPRPGLGWVNQLNQGLSGYGAHTMRYNPGAAQFTNPGDVLGLDLNTATLEDLDAAAMSQYGMDLLTLAATNPDLLDFRQQVMQDPTALWDPVSGSLNQTAIPGLDTETSAARMQAFEDAQLRLQQEQNQYNQALPAELLQRFMTSGPGQQYAERTAEGRRLMGAGGQAQQVAGQSPTTTPQDFSFLFQSAILPDLIQQYLGTAM